MLKLLLVVFIFLTLSFLGMAIKNLLTKNGQLSGTCASKNPFLNKEGKDCSLCGSPADMCKNK